MDLELREDRVLVAMSGGVDSSLVAAILKEKGYEVIGATMQIWPRELGDNVHEHGCCSLTAVEDARRVAQMLNIPYYVLNLEETFRERVIDYFCDAYARGRTPNPCIVCNHKVKWGELLRRAWMIGARYLATGHYARVDREGERVLLRRGVDGEKDQSYALYGLTQKQLAHTLMPLGNYTKGETRGRARELGLAVHSKPDSQEICFVPDDDYRSLITERRPDAVTPGPILDTAGRKLGEHNGLPYYTIGQRRGLGLALNEPHYVVDLDVENNAVIVGTDEQVMGRALVTRDVNMIAWEEPRPYDCEVQIRYNAAVHPAHIRPLDGSRVYVRFDEPVRAITPGQSAVFYDGDLVLGGGIIERKDT